jgi:hypothetical protein
MASLPRPDVTVKQVFETQKPTTVAPLLRSCIVGACKQVVPATVASATGSTLINSEANVTLPASMQAADATGGTPTAPTYALSARSAFEFSVNNKVKVSMLFEDAGNYAPSTLVQLIRDAMAELEETDAVAELVKNTDGVSTSFRVRTVATDEFQQIEVDPDGQSAAVLTGTVDLTTVVFPGDVSGETIIVSVGDGAPQTITLGASANAAAMAAEIAALTGATASVVADFLVITSDATDAGASLEITGGTLLPVVGFTIGDRDTGTGSTSSLLTAFGLTTKDIFFGASRYANWELVIPPSSFPDPRENLDSLVFDIPSLRGFLNVSGSSLKEALQTSAPLRWATAAVTVVDDGNGDNRSPFLNFAGMNFSTAAGSCVVTGSAAPTFVSVSNKTLILGDGRAPRTVEFGTVANIAEVVAAINAEFDTSDGILASDSGGFLRLTCTRKREDGVTSAVGVDAEIVIYGGTVFNDGVNNYLDPGVTPTLAPGRYNGSFHPPLVGDEVFVDGVSMGKIVRVAPSGVNTRLQLSKQQSLSFTGATFSIVANGLSATNMVRPSPALVVEEDGQMVLKHGLIRTPQGPVSQAIAEGKLIPSKADMYVSYSALRLDVSSKRRGLLQLISLEQVESLLSPIDETNPLGLGAYLAMQASPDTQITALGIDTTSTDYPEGTPAAFARAAVKLEAHEVYTISLLTHDQESAEAFQTHVRRMSAPEGKRERHVIWCPKEPTQRLDTLAASGSKGNTVGSGGALFDTNVADLETILQEYEIDTTAAIPVSDGLYLDVASDSGRYAIIAVNGSVVTITDTFAPGENEDSYFLSTLLGTLIDESFGVRIRGEALVLPDGSEDLQAIAETYQALGESMMDQRVWIVAPDEGIFNIGGTELVLPNYYAGSVIAGMVTRYSVSQSFTNLAMSGISRVVKSNGRFTEEQLDLMAGGGIYILMQETASRPVFARQAITSDSSDEVKRIDIVLKQIDLLAKLVRNTLRSTIGVVNVSEALLDDMGTKLQALIDFAEGKNLIKKVEVLSIEQSATRVDGTSVALKAYPHYPNNGIEVTIYI